MSSANSASNNAIDARFAEEEQELADLGREIPTYGGHFLGPNRRVVVWVTDPKDAAAARSSIRQRLINGRYHSSGGPISGAVEVRQGKFTIGQLASWRKILFEQKNLSGVAYVDLNEGTNRIEIGLDGRAASSSAEDELRSRLAMADIPDEALTFARGGGAKDVTSEASSTVSAEGRAKTASYDATNSAINLGWYADTLVGGLRYTWRDTQIDTAGSCTIGFTAELSSGAKGFVSASHCSPIKFFTDVNWIALQQPNGGPSIGFEQWDASLQLCNLWEFCGLYRYSDANINVITGRPVKVGYLASPTTRNYEDGNDTTINAAGIYLQVVGTTNYVLQGSTIDHIGASKGWRYGSVTNSCATFYITWSTVIRCAYKTDINVTFGDSGGPLFYYSGQGTYITAAGIMFRQDGGGSWFSQWRHVQDEITGAFPAPQWVNITAPVPISPVVSIIGPSEMRPGNSCYWYVSSNFQPTGYEWKVNGVVVGANADIFLSRTSSFTLEVNAWNASMSNSATAYVAVSNSFAECFVQ